MDGGETRHHTERSVLLLGSSLFVFSDTGAADALPSLVSRRLEEAAPRTAWSCSGEMLLQTGSSVERTARLMEKYRPDAVVFEMTTYQFVHRATTTRIRQRWPALYGPSRAVMDALKRAAGGTFEGGSELKGLLFRLPRSAAYRIIGADVEQEVEVSLTHTLATLDEVLRHEQVAVVCSMPKFQWREPEMDWCRGRVGVATERLRGYCAQRHIPMYDVEKELAARGRRPGLARDAIHYDKSTREFEADLVSAAVLAALGV